MRNNFYLSKDKLRLCYTTTQENYNCLAETKTYQGEGFRLTALPTDCTMLAIDILGGEAAETWERLGTIQVDKSSSGINTERYVWVDIENKVLYPKDNYHNNLACLDFITNRLGLQFHNFTALDIAIDTNRKELLKRVKKGIRKYTPIFLGKAYENKEEVIDRLFYIQQTSRTRVVSESLYIDNSEKTCGLRVYNKTAELEESRKDYISRLHGDEAGTFWRVEVRLKNKALKAYLDVKGMSMEDLYGQVVVLGNTAYIADIFNFFHSRLLYFRDDKGKTFNLFQLKR